MQRFYFVNVILLSVLYLVKIVSLAVFDYNWNRPDLTWAGLEITDAILLSWYTISVLPRKKSAIYVDMSRVSDERLHQAESWRAHQEDRAEGGTLRSSRAGPRLPDHGSDSESETSNAPEGTQGGDDGNDLSAMEAGTQQAIVAPTANVEPQPPWVNWTSGMSLPRPNPSTWGGYTPVTRIIRRERRLVPVLPPSIVLGVVGDQPGALKLSLGKPLLGPNCIPKVFDEKGVEIESSRRSMRSNSARMRSSSSCELGEGGESISRGDEEGGSENSGTRVRLDLALRRLRFRAANSGAARSNERSVEDSGITESSERNMSILSHHDGLQIARSVASSGASCDGVVLPAEEDDEISNRAQEGR